MATSVAHKAQALIEDARQFPEKSLPTNIDRRTFVSVSKEQFDEIIKAKPAGVLCTQEEIDKINEQLGSTTKLLRSEARFYNDLKCECCSRQINFYDVFQQGVKLHGVTFLKWAMLDGNKKIQMFPDHFKQTIECSECGHKMTRDQYDHYSTKDYACA